MPHFHLLYIFNPLCLTLYSHLNKWVVVYSFVVTFKEPSVNYGPKIANVFGGRSTQFGTDK